MSVRHLAETTVNLIITQIQNNIASALAAVTADSSPNKSTVQVTTEPPRTYFIYENPQGYTTPAVIVVCDEFDFRPAAKGANHISAVARIGVACVLEDRDLQRLTVKAYRYLDAFHNVLAQTEIDDPTDGVKLIIIVKKAGFTPHYYPRAQSDPQGLFRKEVQLECEVEHYENF